ncbi:branched-chain-amino-acid aminotransferase, mitochondrial isoform 2-T2 [Dama dama]|uniref:branched-chain-amino-acid aminotransferase, mitochondrial isoform X2 n=1 Tax=Dama dama TaxID=30532 RepID=UPI002A36629D|nr:branched-chain-amino-acid aminotransferase, mitochondrial isoform X2 [Dama dama]
MHTLASGLEGECVSSYSLLLAGSSACALRYGPAPRGRPATGKARPAWGARLTNHPTEGGVSGAGPESLYPGPRPGQAQIPAAKTMAAAALRQLFEGMKAFKGGDQRVRLFRPWLNMERMLRSALRLCLPSFDKIELLECIRRLVEVDQDWVPGSTGTSLYVRPVLIGNEPSLGVGHPTRALLFVILSPVGTYFSGDALKPISLLADPSFIRAWVGGVGDYKLGGNYGPTVLVQQEAQKKGCEQVLWLYGPDHELTEVGTMNIFVFWTYEDGVLELVTPPLDGIILPGVVRQSLLDLARTWGEFRVVERKITMKEFLRALEDGRVQEVFGSGTACQVCPVHQILYQGEHVHIPTMENGPQLILRFYKELKAIQYGSKAHEWMLPV